jgi:hypothetical protein
MALCFKAELSREVGVEPAVAACAETIRRAFRDEPLSAVLFYATVNHDQEALVRAVGEAFPGVAAVGCSTSAVTTHGAFFEDGYLLGMMGLGGSSLRAASACAEGIDADTAAKARAMGEELRLRGGGAPEVVLLHYDPLCPVDIELFAATLQDTAGCPVVGGSAGQPWGPMVQTHQYHGQAVLGRSAVALALWGDFVFALATTTGTSPTGLTMKVTRAEGNLLLELDGRRALDVYDEIAGTQGASRLTSDANSALAMGIERGEASAAVPGEAESIVRGAFGVDEERGGLVLPASIAAGTTVMIHHRTREAVFEGTERMARSLLHLLRQNRIRAAIGCECAARSTPLLGPAEMLRENLMLQALFPEDTEWLGMLAWGELAPYRGRTTFFNFTYPLLVLAEPEPAQAPAPRP